MAAALGGDLMTKVFGYSEAERIVRPWWERLEDFCVYGLLLVGVILIPHAIILGTPLYCTYCQKDFCGANHTNINKTDPIIESTNTPNYLKDPGFQAYWVIRYCTYNGKNGDEDEADKAVSPFLSFYPYIILGVAIGLFFIDKILEILFNAKEKMDKFYKVLVDNNILSVKDNKILSDTKYNENATADGGLQEIELKYAFRKNHNYYTSFILSSSLQIVLALGFLFYMTIRGIKITNEDSDIYCNVHGLWYECHGIPIDLYKYTIYINSIFISIYIFTNIYSILWLLFPWFGKLRKVMRVYKKSKREAAQKDNEKPLDEKILGDLYEIYYQNKDAKLFLDLLAMSSGVAPAISVMAMFDSEFRNSLRAKIGATKIKNDSGKRVEIEISEPESAVLVELDRIASVDVMYVAELDPPTADGAQVYDIGDNVIPRAHLNEVKIDPTAKTKTHKFTFKKLDPNVEKYSCRIRLLVNGHTIVSSTKDVFNSTRANNAKGMDVKAFEENLDKISGNSIIKEEAEKEESLRDKVQDEHMKEIEKNKEGL